jgi:AcrR family transcriptional regulator
MTLTSSGATHSSSQRGAASREAILQAAVRVIGQEGLPGASLAAVAAAAHTSKPAVLYHFGSRERLLREVATLALSLYRSLLATSVNGSTSPRQRVESAIGAIFAPENRVLMACVHELMGLGMRDAAVAAMVRESLDDVARAPARSLAHLGPERSSSIARSLVLAVHGHVELWLCSEPSDAKTFVDAATQTSLAILAAANN